MVMNWARGVASSISNGLPYLYNARPSVLLPDRGRANLQHADLYRVLRAYYYSNDLYSVLRDVLRQQGIAAEALKPLRNPAYRAVEFYPRSLWPGTLEKALPIMADNATIIEPIGQIWQWSNWGSVKQVASRHIALYGDLFIKVSQTEDRRRVFLQLIEPEHFTEFDADERDYLTYARIDVPMQRRNADGTSSGYTHTEVWEKRDNRYRLWEHGERPDADLVQLGVPAVDMPITAFGIDFIPISHAKFADTGEDRGMSALLPALDKIDEANRQATRLNQMLFRHNNVTNALERTGVDPTGRPLPPVQVRETDGVVDSDNTVRLGDDVFLTLPANTTLKQLVPNVNYEAALHILQDHMIELEQDLPELAAYRFLEGREASGRAVRLMLWPAVSRLIEARGNAESALVRADQMALTMGTAAGLWNVGSFDAGDYEHCFEERDILPADDLERAQSAQADGNALKAFVESGVPIELAVQEVLKWTPEKAAQFTVERLAAIEREQTLATEDVTTGVVAQ